MGEELISLPPYELAEVIIGELTTLSRPVAWDREIVDGEGRDSTGEFAVPTEYECTCPHCGNMVRFEAIFEALQCPECNAGENVAIIQFVPPFRDPGEYKQASEPVPEEAPEDIEVSVELRGAIESIVQEDEMPDAELDSLIDELKKDAGQ